MHPVLVPTDRRHNIGGTAVAGDAEVEIVVSRTEPVKVRLLAVLAKRTGGANAATNQPRIYLVSGAAADAASERWRAAAATGAGVLINTYDIMRPFQTIQFPAASADNAGYYGFYFKIDGNAANTFEYEIWYEVLH